MSPHLSRTDAARILRQAHHDAAQGAYDGTWIGLVREVWRFASKTYVPALGTILLAKAVDARVDVGTIKMLPENPHTFSLRNLAHNVLVPLSRELRFSIRTTGREPLNNQPFFRYSHVDEIDRVSNRTELDRYRHILATHLRPLDETASRSALAAFVRVGIDEHVRRDTIPAATGELGAREILIGLTILLREWGPWTAQALGAVLLESFFPNPMVRRLNDPSRNHPGDVQAIGESGHPVLSLEARTKRVTIGDVLAFSDACERADIRRAVILDLSDGPHPLGVDEAISRAWEEHGVALHIIADPPQVLALMAVLGPTDPSALYQTFAERLSYHLAAIEAPEGARVAWAEFVEAERADPHTP